MLLCQPSHHFVVVDSGYLVHIDALGALRFEEDAKGGEAELEVGQHVHVVDVQEVELQLFIGLCIVFSVDLRIAGEAGFDLEAQLEVREFFIILLGDLRALGPRADDAHVALEDVDELGQLIQTAFSDNAADGRDARVILAGGEACDAVLLGVDTHGTELDDLEYLSVYRESLLLIEHGAAVIDLDGDGGDQHQGGQQNQRGTGGHDVEDPLCHTVLRADGGSAGIEDRAVEGLDMHGLAHDDIADMGQEEAGNALFLAVFQDAVADAAVDTGDEDGVKAFELRFQLFEVLACKLQFLFDLIQPLDGLSLDAAQAALVGLVAIDKDGSLGGVNPTIIGIAVIGEQHIHAQVDHQQREKDQGAVPLLPGDGCDEVGQNQGKEMGNKLGEDKSTDPAVAEQIGIIRAVEEKEQEGIEGGNKVVIAIAVVFEHKPAVAEEQPEEKEKQEG